jgi:hypothetical protein
MIYDGLKIQKLETFKANIEIFSKKTLGYTHTHTDETVKESE